MERMKDASFFESIPDADLYRLTLDDVRHRDFNFLFGDIADRVAFEGNWPVRPDQVSATILHCARVFLDAVLKKSEASQAELAAWRSGIAPPGVSAVR